jgi:hypothetical protein
MKKIIIMKDLASAHKNDQTHSEKMPRIVDVFRRRLASLRHLPYYFLLVVDEIILLEAVLYWIRRYVKFKQIAVKHR